MSFAEQLAARAAKKRSAMPPLPISSGNIIDSSDGNINNTTPLISYKIPTLMLPSSSVPPRRGMPTRSSTVQQTQESIVSTARDESSRQSVPPKPTIAEKTKQPPENKATASSAPRMSFGSAIKAKTSKAPPINTSSPVATTAKPVAKYREPPQSPSTSSIDHGSVGGSPPRPTTGSKRDSFNTSITSLCNSIRERRVEGDPGSPGVSPGNGRDYNDLVDESSIGDDYNKGAVDGTSGSGSGGLSSLTKSYAPQRRSKSKSSQSSITQNDDKSPKAILLLQQQQQILLLEQQHQQQQQQQNSSSSIDYKEKAVKLKSENKKLRLESLLLKAKLEIPSSSSSTSSSSSNNNNEKNKANNKNQQDAQVDFNSLTQENKQIHGSMLELQEQYKQLEIKLWEKDKVEEENRMLKQLSAGLDFEKMQEIDRSDKSAGGLYRKKGSKGSCKGGGLDASDKSGRERLDASEKSGMSHESLLQENVRLTQLLLDIGELEELEKLRIGQGDEKDVTILRTQQQLDQTESELAEVTELKNAEIEVLRKQLNRAENLRNGREQTIQEVENQKDKSWSKEREGLREEIRRLNVEISSLKENKYRHHRDGSGSAKEKEEEDQEELDLTSRYNNSNGGMIASQYSVKLDNSDVASLQSIIAMMRQTIDQSNKEKDLLEQRLTTEQERSQMELQAFAKTLEGVDDLRKSAEIMSREIRRIKVKGYRPTRSDLLANHNAGNLDGVRNFGELTAAVEASENMEEAIRLIENQNDAMEERRRMGVVASSAATTTAEARPTIKKEGSRYAYWGGGYGGFGGQFSSSDDREGGFLSFWNHNTADRDEKEGEDNNRAANKKEERKKKSKRKHKRRDDQGSVLTSFF